MNRRHIHVLALAATAAIAGTASAYGQIVFDPSAVPGNVTGGNGTVGVLDLRPTTMVPGNQDQARTVLLDSANTARTSAQYPAINFIGSGSNGHYGNDVAFPQGDGDSIAHLYRGYINVPAGQGGDYTFLVNSDDGFTLAIDNGARAFTGAFTNGGDTAAQQGPYNTITPTYNGTTNGALHFYGGRGTADTGGVVNLTPGIHSFDMTFHEGGGGSAVEVAVAPGAHGGFNNNFQLLGAALPTGRNKVLGVGQFDMVEVTNAGNVDNVISSGKGVIAGTGATGGAVFRSRTNQTSIHFSDDFGPGKNVGSHGGDDVAFPGDTNGIDDNNFGAFAKATLTVSPGDAGNYTFALYSDDSSRFRILNSGGSPVQLAVTPIGDSFDSDGDGIADQFGTNGCCADFLGSYKLAAGTYTIESAFYENGGGSGFFLYGTQGLARSFDASRFQLLGANVDNGAWSDTTPALQFVAVPEPTSIALLGLGGLSLLGRRRKF